VAVETDAVLLVIDPAVGVVSGVDLQMGATEKNGRWSGRELGKTLLWQVSFHAPYLYISE
jgi:hypothetical protein